jgi:hypothetical protein
VRQKIEQYKIIKPTEKELDFFNAWTLKRSKPKWKFVLINGILKEGFFLFSIIKFIQFFIEQKAFLDFYTSPYGILFLFFEIIFWSFGGFVIGWFKYNSKEIEYELLRGLME